MNVSVEQVNSLNAKIKALNEERHRKLGMLESAKQRYTAVTASYATKYGVQLNDQNLQAEYDKVALDVTSAYTNLFAIVDSIEKGTFVQTDKQEPLVINTVVDPTATPSEVPNIGQGFVQPNTATEGFVQPNAATHGFGQPNAATQGFGLSTPPVLNTPPLVEPTVITGQASFGTPTAPPVLETTTVLATPVTPLVEPTSPVLETPTVLEMPSTPLVEPTAPILQPTLGNGLATETPTAVLQSRPSITADLLEASMTQQAPPAPVNAQVLTDDNEDSLGDKESFKPSQDWGTAIGGGDLNAQFANLVGENGLFGK